MNSEKRTLIIISGPTAVGKTDTALLLAKTLKTDILSADSRQFYREMRIGTATPSMDELQLVPHHFIGHLSIHDPYNVSKFETAALEKLDELFLKHPKVIMVGGSGLYIHAVCHGIDQLPDPDPEIRKTLKEMLSMEGIEKLKSELQKLDPEYARMVDLQNPARLIRALEVCLTTGLPYSSLRSNKSQQRSFRWINIGLTLPREILNQRINNRVDQMVHAGLVDEARDLYPFRDLNALNTVGYKELFEHFDGKVSLSQAIENIKTHTRRYAKRQLTWFRKDLSIRWFYPQDTTAILASINLY
ncbi:MAG: tRNA (adenosine(37)-N6)-dimethylallyltransferase MiaA [Bacteroidales bacterium]|nr:tRNA (adenosine(37)-N6)-dimethylallyltransferase MiaA [Bacteroidales bacterium]MDD4603589.1 tRNA (adenosine(37)-N6)-dimethylallyltransferase MiaA [Bacteroidales bacterium]